MLLSGTLWPLEGMPSYLRYFSYMLPQTLACNSMRCLMEKGWGIGHFQVYIGFVTTLTWTLVLMAIGTVLIKKRT